MVVSGNGGCGIVRVSGDTLRTADPIVPRGKRAGAGSSIIGDWRSGKRNIGRGGCVIFGEW